MNQADGQSLVHVINLLGKKELIGAEIGVWCAQTTKLLLHHCPNIKKFYGVDPYLPYNDLIDPLNPNIIDHATISEVKSIAYSNIAEFKHKVEMIEQPSHKAINLIADAELDFVFIDSYIKPEDVLPELEIWYPKVKSGGIFSGHDYVSQHVEDAVQYFRYKYNISNTMSVFDQTFVWIK